MIVRRGYRPPPSLHIERLRAAPPGHFYDVMSHGFGAMPDYAAANFRARPLGDRRLYSRAAVEPKRRDHRRARGGARSALSETKK